MCAYGILLFWLLLLCVVYFLVNESRINSRTTVLCCPNIRDYIRIVCKNEIRYVVVDPV